MKSQEELQDRASKGTLSNMFVFEAVAKHQLTPEEGAQILIQIRDTRHMRWLSRIMSLFW
jgi:uncharacterized membrane protein YjjP (DUF1212 family)